MVARYRRAIHDKDNLAVQPSLAVWGKPLIALNLGYHLSLRSHKVLLIDIDPQGSLTLFMGVDTQNLDKTVFDAIVNEEPLSIHTGIHGMDLAPTNINLSAAEIQLVNMDFREVRLKDAIAPIQDNYDFILIDCPPSLGLLSYISLVAANSYVLVPVETHYKAFEGTQPPVANSSENQKERKPLFADSWFCSLPLCCCQLSGQADSQSHKRAVYDLWPLHSHPAHNCFRGCFRKTSPACCLRT